MYGDKKLEYERYNQRSLKELEHNSVNLDLNGAEFMSEVLRTPYLFYEEKIRENVQPGTTVLDLCCGNGVHSLTAAWAGARVTATDIAEKSLELAAIRAEKAGIDNMQFITADAEQLPFGDASFDVITCVGSLSYVDLEIFTAELRRVLKPRGTFICLDSFDHNPIYRVNRFIHYLRGNRSLSTLKRMPDASTLKYLEHKFSVMDIHYFGIFSFMGGILKKIVGGEKARKMIDRLDTRFNFIRRYAFKVVFVARNK